MELIKPINDFYVWRSAWGVIGQSVPLSMLRYMQARNGDDSQLFIFHGKVAICRVLTASYDISRTEALKFATAIVLGHFSVGNFDLDKCTVNWKHEFETTPHY